MKKLGLWVFFLMNAAVLKAQDAESESQNYKHLNNTMHEHRYHNSRVLRTDQATLINQKTHRSSSRQYNIAPTDSIPATNVQGVKTKQNYKNQFN